MLCNVETVVAVTVVAVFMVSALNISRRTSGSCPRLLSSETAFGLQYTDVVVPATRRSSLGDRAFPSQELGHRTR